MTVATRVIQVTFENGSPAPTLMLGAYEDLGCTPQVTVNLVKGDQRIGTVLDPFEARAAGEWLAGFAKEHLADCWRCKKPVLINQAMMLGQDWVHPVCAR